MIKGINDKNVIAALRAGDTRAFEKIFTLYFGRVKYFIFGLLKSGDDAEELAQDVFVRLWLKRSTLDPEKSLNAFLYAMARNAAFNVMKSRLIHEAYVNECMGEEGECTTEQQLVARETALIIEMTVSRMPQQRQLIYNLSRNGGIANEEIARRLGISKKTVENQLSLALKELRGVVMCLVVFFPGSIGAVDCIISGLQK